MTLTPIRQECARKGCGHDLSTHFRDYPAEASRRTTDPTATGVITGDCLAVGCPCKGFEKGGAP
jgi:hypothetical protein